MKLKGKIKIIFKGLHINYHYPHCEVPFCVYDKVKKTKQYE